jgi:predicted RNA methylase
MRRMQYLSIGTTSRTIALIIVTALLVPLVGGRTIAQQPQPSQRLDVGYAGSSAAVIDAMLKIAEVGAKDVVYDLGSGDGRIVIAAAKIYGARGVGVELDPNLVRVARQAASDQGVADRVTFIQGDLFATDISPATVVTLFLWPSVNKRLETKLRFELRPGTRIVSNSFGIGNWRPDRTVRGIAGSDVLSWTVPRAPAKLPDVPFEPTDQVVADQMLQLAGASERDVVYDLGSGDGRIPVLAAQKYGARAVGIEIDPRLIEISSQVVRDAGLEDRVRFVEGDFFSAGIADATLVTLCLSESVNAKLEARLRRELKPGTRIVSRRYSIGAWAPDRTVRASDGSELLLWTVR